MGKYLLHLPLLLVVLHQFPFLPWAGILNVAVELSRSFSPYLALWALISAALHVRQALRTRTGSPLLFAAGALCAAGVLAYPLAPFVLPREPIPLEAQKFRLLHANVFGPNKNYAAVRRLVEDLHPTAVTLLEAHDGWKNNLALREIFPHSVEITNRMRDGKLLYSQVPILRHTVHQSRDARSSVVEAQLALTPNQSVTILLAHAPSPISADRMAWRRSFLTWVAELGRSLPDPLIVALDMNATPFTDDYRTFAAILGAENSFWGRGYQPTWRVFPHFPLQAMIDHVWQRGLPPPLATQVQEHIGSDHLPLLIDFVLPAPGEPFKS